jgi:uncharacterized membrane protein YdbT with pleckstrin-like domain
MSRTRNEILFDLVAGLVILVILFVMYWLVSPSMYRDIIDDDFTSWDALAVAMFVAVLLFVLAMIGGVFAPQ